MGSKTMRLLVQGLARHAWPSLMLVPLLSCRGLFETSCTSSASPAVQVRVLDALTQQRPPEEVILAIASETVADTARYPAGSGPPVVLAAGFDATGVFEVVVTSEGYEEWRRDNVVVPRARCGQNETEYLVVGLQPGE
jgi:hypothetical protein